MDIKPDRMIALGYGKYWRSDGIVGLMPIEEDRGPRRRTEVYTTTLDYPIVASRSQRAILHDMGVSSDELMRLQEIREFMGELVDCLDDIPDLLKRTLSSEARFDTEVWIRRLRATLESRVLELPLEQNDLFE